MFSSVVGPLAPFAGLSFAAGGGRSAGDFDAPFDVEELSFVETFSWFGKGVDAGGGSVLEVVPAETGVGLFSTGAIFASGAGRCFV